MKITIESEELFSLREKISEQQSELKELKDQIRKLDPDKVEERVKNLGWRLFEKYLFLTFKKLGFQNHPFGSPVDAHGLWHQLGYDWFEESKEDQVTISLGAHMETDFTNAFLKIGVIPKKERTDGLLARLEK